MHWICVDMILSGSKSLSNWHWQLLVNSNIEQPYQIYCVDSDFGYPITYRSIDISLYYETYQNVYICIYTTNILHYLLSSYVSSCQTLWKRSTKLWLAWKLLSQKIHAYVIYGVGVGDQWPVIKPNIQVTSHEIQATSYKLRYSICINSGRCWMGFFFLLQQIWNSVILPQMKNDIELKFRSI